MTQTVVLNTTLPVSKTLKIDCKLTDNERYMFLCELFLPPQTFLSSVMR